MNETLFKKLAAEELAPYRLRALVDTEPMTKEAINLTSLAGPLAGGLVGAGAMAAGEYLDEARPSLRALGGGALGVGIMSSPIGRGLVRRLAKYEAKGLRSAYKGAVRGGKGPAELATIKDSMRSIFKTDNLSDLKDIMTRGDLESKLKGVGHRISESDVSKANMMKQISGLERTIGGANAIAAKERRLQKILGQRQVTLDALTEFITLSDEVGRMKKTVGTPHQIESLAKKIKNENIIRKNLGISAGATQARLTGADEIIEALVDKSITPAMLSGAAVGYAGPKVKDFFTED